MKILLVANLTLRFALELCALAALGYAGWQIGSGFFGIVLAIAFPLAGAVIWGLFVAPKRGVKVGPAERLLWEAIVFAGAAVGLVHTGHRRLAVALTLAWLVNRVAIRLTGGLDQRLDL
jgi:hypothetical protein